jgi:hypothetical protein
LDLPSMASVMEWSFGAMIRHRTDLRPQPIHA